MKRTLVAGVWGLLAGVGVAIAGLARPQVIQGFLDVTGAWNPAVLIAVTVTAAVYYPAYRALMRRGRPLMASQVSLPTQKSIDSRLLLGSSVFGFGWGLAGQCPGATLVALPGGDSRAVWFVCALVVGMTAYEVVNRMLERAAPSSGVALAAAGGKD